IWVRYWSGAVVERFRPDLGRVGWLGWLRPAAAVATGLLVVTGASWAIAALPQVISASGNQQPYTSGSGSNGTHRPTHLAPTTAARQATGPGASSSPQASLNCRTNSPAPSGSASGTPTHSSSASPSPPSSSSPSPPPSSTSSPSPTGPPTTSPSPTG